MRSWFNLPLVLLSALLATAAALPFYTTAQRTAQSYFFQVELTSDQAGRAQLFFDIGNNYNEADSALQTVTPSGKLTRYRFPIPAKVVQKLRFDPIDHPNAAVTLAKPCIVNHRGRTVRRLTVEDFSPAQQVAIVQRDHGELRLTVPNGAYDPILDLHIGPPLDLRMHASDQLLIAVPWWAGAFCACWLLGVLIDKARGPLGRGYQALGRRPGIALAGTAAVAIAIQCHPVIFLGKSFVSPNNGSPFLYASFPSLPGYTDADVEDTKGSDVAALFHGSLYYPSIAHDAIIRDHELPLWNRYFMCGLPLVGQGQSMAGSLLNLLPLLGNASSVSWDIRYIMTRWFYAFGLGVAVWLLTRNLGAALIITFIGPFIGYFGFRLNHMAQFSVECSPWIIVGWLLLRQAASPRQLLGALAMLFLANWEVLNSGTVKEAYMLIGSLNAAGFLIVALEDRPWRERLTRIAAAAAAGAVLLLVAAPVWLIFFDALHSGGSHYDRPMVWQAPAWQFPGFFDDIFYGRLHPQEWHILPSVNVFLALAAAWTLVQPRRAWGQRSTIALWLTGLAAFSLAFTVMPPAWIMRVPLLANVYHVHNTFSCVLVVVVTLLAGVGIDGACRALASRGWHASWILVLLVLAVPMTIYRRIIQGWSGSAFFNGYAPALLLAVIALYLGLSVFRRTRHAGIASVAVLGTLALTGWRFAQYAHIRFDDYVVNPRVRVDFRAPSPAVQAVQQRVATEPSRPNGLSMNLFCGYSEMLGFESIYGTDPVRNSRFDELAVAGGINRLLWGNPETLKEMGGQPGEWHEDNLPVILPVQNLLNMRYYLAPHQEPPAPIAGLKFLGSYDLDVYESEGAWPRAFFTTNVVSYRTVQDLVALAKAKPGAFAGVQRADWDGLPESLRQVTAPPAAPAHDYRLTSNKTAFTVEASGPGIAVLTENFSEHDFRAYLNGERVPYLRVNHAFKGVLIPQAGTFQVRFEYWPRFLNLALTLCATGLVLGAAAAVLLWRRGQSAP